MNEQFDPEEREILDQYDRGKLRQVPNVEAEIEAARRAARHTRKKTNTKSHKSQFRQ